MPLALIISLGGSPEPIVFSFRQRSPDRVCFLASQQSIDLVGKIRAETGRTSEDHTVIVEDPEDLAQCYEKALECFDWAERVLPQREKVVDVTGGTKAMSAALAIAAVARGASFSYVGGERRDRGGLGVVQTGSERLLESVNPWALFAVEEKRNIEQYFNSLQYAAAAQGVGAILPRMRERDRLLLEPIGDAALGYLEWERFNHAGAVEHLKAADRKLGERLKLVDTAVAEPLSSFHCELCDSLANLNALREKTRNFSKAHPLIAVDLVSNAQRRIAESRFDDAVARLYRALELIGQCGFETHFRCTTGDADIGRLPVQLHAEFEARYRSPAGKLELPLFATFRALAEADVELGKRFCQDSDVPKLMSARNSSILAHGLQPVARHAAENLLEVVARYLPANSGTVIFPKLRFQ